MHLVWPSCLFQPPPGVEEGWGRKWGKETLWGWVGGKESFLLAKGAGWGGRNRQLSLLPLCRSLGGPSRCRLGSSGVLTLLFPFFSPLVCAENSAAESTSREAPSQLTSDSFKPPVCFPEHGPKTADDSPTSRSLDRSASAPAVCSPLGGRAEPESPRAGKSLDSLLDPRGWLGSKEPPAPPLNLPDAGAHSPLGGSATFQNIPAASSCPPEKAAHGHEPQEMEGDSGPCKASPETSGPDAPLPLEPPELPPDFKRCRSPRKGGWREPRHVGDVSLPLAAAAEGGEISRGAEDRPEGALAQPPGEDRSLEGPPGPEDPLLLESADASAAGPGTELGLHQCPGLPLPLGLPPASRSTQPGNITVDRPRDHDEEPGISLASALKELHRLLVVSAKHDFRMGGARHEERRSSLEAPEGSATAEEAASSSFQEQARPDLALACPAATEMLEVPHLDGGQQEVAQGASGCGDSVPASPLAVWPPPPVEERLRVPAQRLSSCAAAGLSSLASLGPESRASGSSCSSSPKEGGASSVSPEAEAEPQHHLEQLPEPVSFPGASEPRSPPALAANLDQIVEAGFTPQEAGEALEHAGGNADLALLILLARNIVVPT